jgi:hypothetical protein
MCADCGGLAGSAWLRSHRVQQHRSGSVADPANADLGHRLGQRPAMVNELLAKGEAENGTSTPIVFQDKPTPTPAPTLPSRRARPEVGDDATSGDG